MALAGPPRNHEIEAAAKAIFTPVPGSFTVGVEDAGLADGLREALDA